MRPLLSVLVAVVVIAAWCPDRTSLAQGLDAEMMLNHVRYLADDMLAGRETGEPGADSAAAYIEAHLRAFGLEPLFEGDFRQPFEIVSTIRVGPKSKLSLQTPEGSHEPRIGADWYPFSFSGSGEVTGRALQAGYGMDAAAFTKSDALQKIAVIDGSTPEGMSAHGGIDASLRRRAVLARESGATAVLITVEQIRLPQAGETPKSIGIPAIQIVPNERTKPLLKSEYLRVALSADVQPVNVTGYNVGGLVRGNGDGSRLIVVGAHYDHLGLGGPGSLDPDSNQPHNGADDNASGTAVLVDLARNVKAMASELPADVAFVAFAGEEMGLLGSDHFAENAPFDLANVVAMLNFDMVGRLREGKLQVFGTETATEISDVLDRAVDGSGLTLSRVGDGYGPSDHTSFYARGVPVLHLFSGTHSEYHRPEDDWQLINAEGMAAVGEFALRIITDLAKRDEPLTYVEQQRPQRGGGGYGPYLGTIPDFGEVEGGGLRLSGVRSESPAATAGLQGGDIVLRFGSKEVRDIYDYTYALREHAPGDSVKITVRREGELLDVVAVLGQRN